MLLIVLLSLCVYCCFDCAGKQSLSRLAACVCGLDVATLTLSKSNPVASFLEDMRALFRRIVKSRQDVILLLPDCDIRDDGVLEYINQMLSGGDIAGLFAKDEVCCFCLRCFSPTLAACFVVLR